MTEETKKAKDRYEAAIAALKQGVNILVQEQPSQRVNGECGPKELRTAGITTEIHLAALAKILIESGAISLDHYYESLAVCAEAHVKIHEERLSKMMGGRAVKLA